MNSSDIVCKYAIYGGTFDPIHVGHIALAKAAVDELSLDKLIFMPAYISPFKMDSKASDGKDRCAMIETVLPIDKAFCLSEYELKKGGEASYTIETLKHFDRETDAKLYFVLGFDAIVNIDKWYKGEEILSNYTLVTGRRPDTDDKDGIRTIQGFRERYGADIRVLDMEPVDAASSEIRERIRNDQPISGMVTPEVEAYIKEHGLYTGSAAGYDRFCADIPALEAFMKTNLKESRYRHSLGVEKMAVKLAGIYGEDAAKAGFAGRYHDIAKCFDTETMDSYILRYSLDEGLLGNNALAHSKVGAAILEHEFGVKDEGILNAVRYHTTARRGMSLLEQITYVADVVEENRTYSDLKYYQDLAASDLDQCTLEILEYTLSDLTDKWRQIDKDTLEAYDYIKNKSTQV